MEGPTPYICVRLNKVPISGVKHHQSQSCGWDSSGRIRYIYVYIHPPYLIKTNYNELRVSAGVRTTLILVSISHYNL